MPVSHILLVDDDALLRRSLVLNLEEAGYRASASATAGWACPRLHTAMPAMKSV